MEMPRIPEKDQIRIYHLIGLSNRNKNLLNEIRQESVLRPLWYLTFTADLLATKNTTIATFVDDAALLTTSKIQ